MAIGATLLTTAAVAGTVLASRRTAKHWSKRDGNGADSLAPRVRDAAILRALVEHAPVGIAFFAPDGESHIVNDFMRRLRSRLFGKVIRSWDDLRPSLCREDGREISGAEWHELFETAKTKRTEYVLRNRFPNPSTPQHVSNVLAPVRAEDGRLLGVVGIGRDVTSELAIRQLREELVAVITHDLRSPIAAILFSADQALHRPAGPDGSVAVSSEALQRICRSARRLGDMVSELLDASRVELATLPLERATVDLPVFLSQLVNDLTPSLRGHPVETDFPPQPVQARIDRLRLAQVVTNLLDNASKYSREGSTIHLALREEGATLDIGVTDEGEGIDAADVPKLFDRFYQAKKARQKKSGLGLGLYITKGIVDAHGGTLTVDTARGVGSTFHVRLPRES